MIVLRVQVNDEPAINAGAEDLSVLNAIVNAVGPLGEKARPARSDEAPSLFLSVGGLTARQADVADEHLRWVTHRELALGDRITVQILDSKEADPIESGLEAKKRQDDEREYFEHSKKVYFELRDKYGP